MSVGYPSGAWPPILEGALAERAREAIDAIAEALPATFSAWQPGAEPPRTPPDASLCNGRAGLALLYAYLAGASPGQEHEAIAARLLDEATAAASERDPGLSLCGGLAGVAFAATQLQGLLGDPGADPFCRQVDERLREHLARSPWLDDYDLLFGLVGLGVYALERLPEPVAAECLERVVERLAETAERRPEGFTWWTSSPLTGQPERFPGGFYCLGLAHGVPGVIGLLGQACAANVATGRARPLLDAAVAWLLAQKLPEEARSAFPALIGPGIEPWPARLAWCYGDLGIAAALLVAARCVGEACWEGEALALARRAAERPAEGAGVVDAPLCHGAIGVGHVFNRLFQMTGEPALQQAGRFWLGRGLELRRPGQPMAGFSFLTRDQEGRERRVARRGLLEGAAGIGLALLAATSLVEPVWDRALMVSGRVGWGPPADRHRHSPGRTPGASPS